MKVEKEKLALLHSQSMKGETLSQTLLRTLYLLKNLFFLIFKKCMPAMAVLLFSSCFWARSALLLDLPLFRPLKCLASALLHFTALTLLQMLPRPDGTMAFFNQYWELISSEVIAVLQNFHVEGFFEKAT